MTRFVVRAPLFAVLLVLAAAFFFYSRSIRAADDRFPIYFDDSTVALKTENVNRATYLPLKELVDHLHLPYTDAKILELFTIGSSNNPSIVLAKNSRLIQVNGQQTLLAFPVLREGQQWLVPIDFLTQALSRVTGVEFRYKPGASRIFAGKVTPAELVMNAQALGSITRLTIGTSSPVNLNLKRDATQHRAVLEMGSKPVDPLRERLDYRDRLVRSIAFEDSDGAPRIVIETTDGVGDIRVSKAEEGRVHFVDFLKPGASPEAEPATAPPGLPSAVTKLDPLANKGIRVVVIDPGHGGMDAGATSGGVTEKDLALAISRTLRTALRDRLGVTVLLTRDSDVALTNEARSAVANNNQADLFLSLHIGYSPDKRDSGSSIYVIKEDFAGQTSAVSSDRLFLPWYMGYHANRNVSGGFASTLQEEFHKTLPDWKFPIRSGPIAVLASTTMPAVAFEIGNLNSAANSQIVDGGFQGRIVSTIVAAVERFAAARRSGA
jgi:N-acetylmuramoyl-L-alanine amidase